MQKRQLGHSDLWVSPLCLGTMTWGEQNTQAEAHAQIDMALEYGVNFIDVAEMYPVPGKIDTQGATESILGEWLKTPSNRSQVVVATKVTGPSKPMYWIRGEDNKLDAQNITEALHGSLKRLQVDTIDLYQVHWPERLVNNFGRLNFPIQNNESTPIFKTLETLSEFVRQGKIRNIGISNETPWGIMQYLQAAKDLGLEKIVSLQNPFNLLNRTLEQGISEVLIQEKISLMAYSTLAFGWLTGKYDHNQRPEGTRLQLFERFCARYNKDIAFKAALAYNDLARSIGISPAQMALAWINQHPVVTSNIIGATTLAQLKENLESPSIKLDESTLNAIDALQAQFGSPAP